MPGEFATVPHTPDTGGHSDRIMTDASRDARPPATVLADVAARLRPLLPPAGLPGLAEAVARAAAGRVRILVIGEAKRGKSSLVNALFERDLLPTGALPLTSVATVVTVASRPHAEVRYLDGRVEEIGLADVAGLVSQRGNPDNVKRVDRVVITAPSPHLPVGTDVVDTPGTGSVHQANTDESTRARSTVDLAVLVVAADPPVSAAELALVTDALTTAAAAAVVVNKTDLVDSADVAEIVAFTRDAVRAAVGEDLPAFAMSLRAVDAVRGLVGWLTDRLAGHGGTDVVTSTARALRRETVGVLDSLRVEHELLRHASQDSTDATATLREIVDRAAGVSLAVADHVRGESQRARAVLDEQHEREVAEALRAARRESRALPPGQDSPEGEDSALHDRIGALVALQCAAWFEHVTPELDAALRRAEEDALAELGECLAVARRSAERVLKLRLAAVEPPTPRRPPPLPRLDLGQDAVWRELVSSTIAHHLPAEMRRRRLRRQLRDWVESTVPRPFGRARAALQYWLTETTGAVERELAATCRDQLAALQQGLAAAERHRDHTGTELAEVMAEVTERMTVARGALRDLETLLAIANQPIAARSPVS